MRREVRRSSSAVRYRPRGTVLIIRSGEAEAAAGTAPSMIGVLNWFEELKPLVPTT